MAMTFHITNFAHVSCLHFIFAYMYHPRWEEGQEAQRPRRTDLTGGTAGKKHRDHVGPALQVGPPCTTQEQEDIMAYYRP